MLRGLTRISALIVLGLMLGLASFVWLVPGFVASPVRPAWRLPSSPVAVSTGTRPLVIGGQDLVADEAIRLLFVGDVMLDRNVLNRTVAAKSDRYPFEKLPSGWFDTYDYALANLEGPLTATRRPPEKSIDFQFDPARWTPILKATGIDAFSQANNHALDQGAEGYADSVQRLKRAGFLVFGHQVQDGEVAFATTTIRGKTVGFLGYNVTDNALDKEAAHAVFQRAKPEVDWLLVFMHWGTEYHDTPDPSQVELAHWFIDEGADAVIGGHPHWVQGISSYKGKPIVYSLGNFVFDQDWSEETKRGMAVGLRLVPGHLEVAPIPLQITSSQPQVLDDPTSRLEALAKISDPELRLQIKAGKVVFACNTICRK
jgi:poly-gamma-glutamate synthesis protein (capsule biosynthesis protein)